MAEGYAQAGMVGFSRRDMFVDGRASLAVPLDKAARTKAGASISGGAQPGVSRLEWGRWWKRACRLERSSPVW
jgi:hypothetical protein